MRRKLISFSFLLCCLTPAISQTKSYPCQPEAAIRSAISKLPTSQDALLNFEQRTEPIRSLLKQNPGDLFVHQKYQDAVSAFSLGNVAASALDQYQALLNDHPNDPLYLYLYGRMLILLKRKAAEGYLIKATEQAPNFAWSHLSLVELYQFPGTQDKQKAQAHLQSFLTLCPSCLEAYPFFSKIDDTNMLIKAAQTLRTLIETQQHSGTLAYYRSLWELESRAKPPAELPQVRSQVKDDVAQLRARNLQGNLDWYQALLAGYKLLDDTAGAIWTEDRILKNVPDSTIGIYTLISRWHKEHPRPTSPVTPEMGKDLQRVWYEAAREWTHRWPTAMSAWMELHQCLAGGVDISAEQMIDDEEEFLRIYELNKDRSFAVPPFAIEISEILFQNNLHLDEIPSLVQRGMQTMEAQEGVRTQFDVYDRDFRDFAENVVNTNIRGRQILFDLAMKSNQLQDARTALVSMESDVQRHVAPPEDASPGAKTNYKYRWIPFWTMAARLAEAENRKLDAIAFYQRICTLNPQSSSALSNARKLWQELGGTGEGWQILLPASELANDIPREASRNTPPKVIPKFSLSDLKGREWKITDLKGKVTLINFWATWCGPCRVELPEVQKLYERLKGRQELQVITFNMDENLAVVAPFVEKSGFSFPVIPARVWAEEFNPVDYLPQSWVVLPNGTFVITPERTADSLLNQLEETLKSEGIKK